MQLFRVELQRTAVLHGGDWREVIGVDAAHRRLIAGARQLQLARPGSEGHLDLLAGQGVDEVDEQPGGHGDRALFLHLRAYPATERDLEIRRRQLQAALFAGEQDVRRYRQRAPQGDSPSDDAEAFCQVLLETRYIHN